MVDTKLRRRGIRIKLRLIFYSRYDSITGCFVFGLRPDKDGYGSLKVYGKVRRAHRLMLEEKLHRRLADNEQALHACNNQACISVAKGHVYLGDHRQNMIDASRDGLMRGYVR